MCEQVVGKLLYVCKCRWAEGGGRTRRRRYGREYATKNKNPTQRCGEKMLCQPKQMVNLTTKIVMSANIWTLKSHKHWLVAEDFGPSFLYEMTIGVESASMCKPCLGVPLMLKKS